MRSLCFIYNSGARRNRSGRSLKRLGESVAQRFEKYEIIEITGRDNISTVAREAASRHDVVVACGGDGTVRETAVGLMGTRAVLGVLPLGTGNDFSKTLGIPGGLEEGLDALQNGEVRPVDMGSCNDFWFINTLGFGFDGLANAMAEKIRLFRGSAKYTLAALKAVCKFETWTAEFHTGEGRTDEELIMLTIANGRVEGGSFKIAPGADPSDHFFEVVTVKPVPRWALPFLLPFFVTGKQSRLPQVRTRRCRSIRFRCDRPVPVHADGEMVMSDKLDFEVKVIPDAVRAVFGA